MTSGKSQNPHDRHIRLSHSVDALYMSGARPIEWINDHLQQILDLPNRLRTRRENIAPAFLSLIGRLFKTGEPYFGLKPLIEGPIILGDAPTNSDDRAELSRCIDQSLSWVEPHVEIDYVMPSEIAKLIQQQEVHRLSNLHVGEPDPKVTEWLAENGKRYEWRELCQLSDEAAKSLAREICENYGLNPRYRFLLIDLFRKLIIYHIQVVALELEGIDFRPFIDIICGRNINYEHGMIPLAWGRKRSNLLVLCRQKYIS